MNKNKLIININDTVWEVVKVPSHDSLLIVNNETCCGATWCTHGKIALSDEMDTDTARRTIRHELSHAYLYCTQIRTQDSYTEEELCDFMGIYGKQIEDTTCLIYAELYEGET